MTSFALKFPLTYTEPILFFQEHARELLVVSLPNTKGMFEFPPLHNSTPGSAGAAPNRSAQRFLRSGAEWPVDHFLGVAKVALRPLRMYSLYEIAPRCQDPDPKSH